MARESGKGTEFTYAASPKGGHVSSVSPISGGKGEGHSLFRRLDLSSAGRTETCVYPFNFEGATFDPTAGKSWKTNHKGMKKLLRVDRLINLGAKIYYKLFFDDYPVVELANIWNDTAGGFTELKRYVVETNPVVIRRCMLMATDP